MRRPLLALFGFLLLTVPAVEQTAGAGPESLDPKSAAAISTAVRATAEIRTRLYDPTSFTLLSLVSITKVEKDGSTFFGGCVHYVGSNLYGGRMQIWGGYYTKKGKLYSFPGTATSHCDKPGKDTVFGDITEEVRKGLPSL